MSKLSGKQKTTPDNTLIGEKWYDNEQLTELLNQHLVNVGGKAEEYTIPVSNPHDLRTVEVSIGRVKSELSRIKSNKAVN